MHWGREVTIAAKQSSRKRHAAVRSALACQAQAMELELLFPLFELAKRYPRDFQVMLHQHDGVTICFSRRVEQWKERIEKAVAARAKELDIHTYLEWERL